MVNRSRPGRLSGAGWPATTALAAGAAGRAATTARVHRAVGVAPVVGVVLVTQQDGRAAGLATQRLAALPDGDDGQPERDGRVGPPPAEHRVEHEPDEDP